MIGPYGPPEPPNRWRTLDRDLKRLGRLEVASAYVSRPLIAGAIAVVFVLLAGGAAVAVGGRSDIAVLAVAAVLAGYMALNIGANDIGNTMGPAVGARAIGLGAALFAAAVAEGAGALISGREVVATISGKLIPLEGLSDPRQIVPVMIAALAAASLWINLAGWLRAPVSTTHAIVGAVAGAGVCAVGPEAVNWPQIGGIAVGWVLSPLLGGGLAAGFLALVNALIADREDKIVAAQRWLPVLIGVMVAVFGVYVFVRALPALSVPAAFLPGISLILGGLAWLIARPVVRRAAIGLENRRRSLRRLFGPSLVMASLLLCFAHGSNDVSNAIGPLVAIVEALGQEQTQAGGPVWTILLGATGLSVGLVVFGARLIRIVGSEITRLNPVRSWCVALSTAMTVLMASAAGLPVSSTHIAVGGVFGVGFYREWQSRRAGPPRDSAAAPPEVARRRRLVRRSHVLTILAAWIVTVPLCAAFAGLIYALARLSGLV
ncbi:inorganic phosphate transporter [Haematobacter missouriensis]|mgnify:CR=1 FL=1|uniref:Phosphate transporter n=1 Tax=Haematobacter missouriensis TaxID=366616 RepID=A0A212AU67_9RHOB|nr:inorganic phosphate transporter [Haematobacter missouriensis]OWJ75796.1 inorganic phosphate transporter [Haematobacter missouriensis]OWJ84985.1 inorganic phosphate transporter [Haematobacter missouriensis]